MSIYHSYKASGVKPTSFLLQRGLILHKMLPKFVFEAYFLLLSYYPKQVSKEIGNIFNWKTTHYPWVKLLLNSLSSPFYFYGGTFLPPQLRAIAFYQYTNPCNFSKSLQILSNFQRIRYIATGHLDKVFLAYVTPNKTIVIGISLSNRIVESSRCYSAVYSLNHPEC